MGAKAHGGALEGSGWAGASGMGPLALHALVAGGSGSAAWWAFTKVRETARVWVCCRPVCQRRFYWSPGKERGGQRRSASGGGAQGPREAVRALPDWTGLEGCAHRLRQRGGWGESAAPVLFLVRSGEVNAPRPPFTRAAASTRAFSNLPGLLLESGAIPAQCIPNCANSLTSTARTATSSWDSGARECGVLGAEGV